MKFLLILTFTVLLVAEVYASNSTEENSYVKLSQKESLRVDLACEIKRATQGGIELYCPRPLTPEQLLFGNEKIQGLVSCLNATLDIFLDKFDDNMNFNNIRTTGQVARLFAAPVCEIFDDIFRCVGDFSSAIDLCLDERERIFKNKLFAIVPLLHQSACLRNGDLLAEILEHTDGEDCLHETIDGMVEIGFVELFFSESKDLFGDAIVCRNFNDLLREVYLKVGECSLGVLELVKDMLGFFCEGTKCDRIISDLQCV